MGENMKNRRSDKIEIRNDIFNIIRHLSENEDEHDDIIENLNIDLLNLHLNQPPIELPGRIITRDNETILVIGMIIVSDIAVIRVIVVEALLMSVIALIIEKKL